MKFNIILFISFFLVYSCGEKKKKVYTQFDTVEVISESDTQLDDSAKNGGIGFEKYAKGMGWVTNTDLNLSGDANAIK